jgi:opine dehydrogenase
VKAPPTLDHRYLHEDVGWGLVQWINLARLAHAPTPTMEALTTLAGILNGLDYYADGLTIDRMGMADTAAQDIAAHARDGPP